MDVFEWHRLERPLECRASVIDNADEADSSPRFLIRKLARKCSYCGLNLLGLCDIDDDWAEASVELGEL